MVYKPDLCPPTARKGERGEVELNYVWEADTTRWPEKRHPVFLRGRGKGQTRGAGITYMRVRPCARGVPEKKKEGRAKHSLNNNNVAEVIERNVPGDVPRDRWLLGGVIIVGE